MHARSARRGIVRDSSTKDGAVRIILPFGRLLVRVAIGSERVYTPGVDPTYETTIGGARIVAAASGTTVIDGPKVTVLRPPTYESLKKAMTCPGCGLQVEEIEARVAKQIAAYRS